MPCCVSGCAGSARLVQFPSDGILQRRWCDAIELATGTGLTMVAEQSLELCEDHFETDSNPADQRYREPVRFTDRTGQSVELGGCRLCHRIEVASLLYSLRSMTADVTIGTVLRESIKVQLEDGDFLRFVCGVCLAQVGMVLTIQKSLLVKGDPGAETSERTDQLTEVTCCWLCHRYEPTDRMCFLDDELAEGVTIGSTLNTILQSEFDLMQLICLECLAKVDLMRSIQSIFVGKEEEFRGWQREDLVTVDSDCNPELMLEVKVEPVEIHETVAEGRKRRAKREASQVITTKKQNQCMICLKVFKKKHGLRFHLLLHTGELPHKCSHCDASFRMSTELSKHVMGVHEGKTPYDCKECNLPLGTRAEYYRHRRMAHPTGHKNGNVYFRCLVCDTPCKNVGELRKHIATLHEESYPYLKCPQCPTLQLTCEAHFRAHAYCKHPENRTGEKFFCEKCGKEFDKRIPLQKHVRAVHADPETKKYSCPHCDKSFRLYSTYHRHKDTHAGIRRYACTICDQKFSQSNSLKSHIRNVHALEKSYRCEDCGDCFRNSSLCNKHRAVHHSGNTVVEEKVSCPICLDEFLTKTVLRQHVKIAHEERKEFGCLECDKVFVSFDLLMSHRDTHKSPSGEVFKNSKHPEADDQAFACESCGDQFAQKAQLTKHRRSAHPEQNQHVCPECGKLYSSSSTLRQHRKTHSGIRKHRCTFCEMSFTQVGPLKNHIRNRHTGETPFGCERCGEAFKDSSLFYRHRGKCRK